ncbi:neuromedin-B isoform X2 [Macaca thibetana thibetana]|uniref:neuromedin-B isoform X2 n=1 Tax=Macaca thibetana thibetana TaxID=257877 RepID=UPI0021BC719A|nr:neuromedin-B isoform X2 [Macaca thibetana thibetana]
MARQVGGARLLSSLLLFALLAADVAPLSWDLPEPRNRAGKIRVHQRGNLWATGKAEGAGFATTQTPLWLLGEVEGPRTGRLSIFLPQQWKRGRDEELSP